MVVGVGTGMWKAHAHVYVNGQGHVQVVPRGYSPALPAQPSCNHPATLPWREVLMAVPEILLDHERLDVYNLAREFARAGNVVVQQVPPGRADLVDQFRRTSLSVPLNIAEGAGEFAPKEKARFYRIAKRSATECAAVHDHMIDLNLLHPAEVKATKLLLRRIIGALVKLILSTERIAQPRQPAAPAPAPARKRARAPST